MTTIRKFIDSISIKTEDTRALTQNEIANNISVSDSFRVMMDQHSKLPTFLTQNRQEELSSIFLNSPIQKHLETTKFLNEFVHSITLRNSPEKKCGPCCNRVDEKISIPYEDNNPSDKIIPIKHLRSKQQRKNALHELMIEIYLKYQPISPNALWRILQKTVGEEDCILQTIDSWTSYNPKIYWISSYGNEQTMNKRTFQNFFYQKLKLHS